MRLIAPLPYAAVGVLWSIFLVAMCTYAYAFRRDNDARSVLLSFASSDGQELVVPYQGSIPPVALEFSVAPETVASGDVVLRAERFGPVKSAGGSAPSFKPLERTFAVATGRNRSVEWQFAAEELAGVQRIVVAIVSAGALGVGKSAFKEIAVRHELRPLPVVSLEAVPPQVVETDTTEEMVTVFGRLDAPSEGELRVPLKLAGSAILDQHYRVEASPTLVFPAGTQQAKVSIWIKGDSQPDGDRTIVVTPEPNESAYRLSPSAEARIAVTEDDRPRPLVRLALTGATLSEAEDAKTAVITATIVGEAEEDVVLKFAAGGAASPNDYSLSSGSVPTTETLTIEKGQKTQQLTVKIANDSDPERDELLALKFSEPPTAKLDGRAEFEITLTSDDKTEVSFTAEPRTRSLAESPGTTPNSIKVVATIASPIGVALELPFTVNAEAGLKQAATPGQDFEILPAGSGNKLVIAAGSTRGEITLRAKDDTEFELDETLVLAFGPGPAHSVRGASPGGNMLASFTIKSDDSRSLAVEWAGNKLTEGKGGVSLQATVVPPFESDIVVPLKVTGIDPKRLLLGKNPSDQGFVIKRGEAKTTVALDVADDKDFNGGARLALEVLAPMGMRLEGEGKTAVDLLDDEAQGDAIVLILATDHLRTEGRWLADAGHFDALGKTPLLERLVGRGVFLIGALDAKGPQWKLWLPAAQTAAGRAPAIRHDGGRPPARCAPRCPGGSRQSAASPPRRRSSATRPTAFVVWPGRRNIDDFASKAANSRLEGLAEKAVEQELYFYWLDGEQTSSTWLENLLPKAFGRNDIERLRFIPNAGDVGLDDDILAISKEQGLVP